MISSIFLYHYQQ